MVKMYVDSNLFHWFQFLFGLCTTGFEFTIDHIAPRKVFYRNKLNTMFN